MTYADLLGFYGSLMHLLQPRYLLLGAALSTLLAIILMVLDRPWATRHPAYTGRGNGARTAHLACGPESPNAEEADSLDLACIARPIGLYCLIGYGLSRYSYLMPAAGGWATSLAVASIPISAALTLLFLVLTGPTSTPLGAARTSQRSLMAARTPLRL